MNWLVHGIFGIACLGALALLQPARAQQPPPWPEIACNKSKLTVPAEIGDNATCSRGPTLMGRPGGPAMVCEYERLNLRTKTRANSLPILAWTSVAPTTGFCTVGRRIMSQDADDIRHFGPLGNARPEQADAKEIGNARILQLTLGERRCLGFRNYGPHAASGYAWMITGFYCEPPGQAPTDQLFTDDEVARYLAMARVK